MSEWLGQQSCKHVCMHDWMSECVYIWLRSPGPPLLHCLHLCMGITLSCVESARGATEYSCLCVWGCVCWWKLAEQSFNFKAAADGGLRGRWGQLASLRSTTLVYGFHSLWATFPPLHIGEQKVWTTHRLQLALWKRSSEKRPSTYLIANLLVKCVGVLRNKAVHLSTEEKVSIKLIFYYNKVLVFVLL